MGEGCIGGDQGHIGLADTQGQGGAVLQEEGEGIVSGGTAPLDGDQLAVAGEIAGAFTLQLHADQLGIGVFGGLCPEDNDILKAQLFAVVALHIFLAELEGHILAGFGIVLEGGGLGPLAGGAALVEVGGEGVALFTDDNGAVAEIPAVVKASSRVRA